MRPFLELARLAEQIALHALQAHAVQRLGAFARFHALGDHVDRQAPGDVDEPAHDFRVAHVLGHIRREAGRNLDVARIEDLEVFERGVALAEIVHRHPHARFAQRLHIARHAGKRWNGAALGHLDHQALGRPSVALQGTTDVLDQRRIADLIGLDIDRDVAVPARPVGQHPRLGDGFFHHPEKQLAGLCRGQLRQEHQRGMPLRRIFRTPAEQHLQPDDLPRRETYLRLINQCRSPRSRMCGNLRKTSRSTMKVPLSRC